MTHTGVVLAAIVLLGTSTAAAQPASRPPAAAEPGAFRLERTRPAEQQGSRDQELYPTDVRSTFDPAFFVPATVTVRRGPLAGARVGLSAWTAQALPFTTRQGDTPHATGDPAVGLTVMWGGPPAETGPPPAGR